MIIFDKNVKANTSKQKFNSRCTLKVNRRTITKIKKITKANKEFLQALGFKI